MLVLSEACKIACAGGCGADQICAKAVPEKPGHGSIEIIAGHPRRSTFRVLGGAEKTFLYMNSL